MATGSFFWIVIYQVLPYFGVGLAMLWLLTRLCARPVRPHLFLMQVLGWCALPVVTVFVGQPLLLGPGYSAWPFACGLAGGLTTGLVARRAGVPVSKGAIAWSTAVWAAMFFTVAQPLLQPLFYYFYGYDLAGSWIHPLHLALLWAGAAASGAYVLLWHVAARRQVSEG